MWYGHPNFVWANKSPQLMLFLLFAIILLTVKYLLSNLVRKSPSNYCCSILSASYVLLSFDKSIKNYLQWSVVPNNNGRAGEVFRS